MITADTADQLDALGTAIAALQGADAATDAQYLALIAPVMLAIDGRTMAPGFRYTLNVTNALQGRAKHWRMILDELEPGSPWPVTMNFEYLVSGNLAGFVSSPGQTLGLATCAAICLAWAKIIRLWIAGNYPLGVSQP